MTPAAFVDAPTLEFVYIVRDELVFEFGTDGKRYVFGDCPGIELLDDDEEEQAWRSLELMIAWGRERSGPIPRGWRRVYDAVGA